MREAFFFGCWDRPGHYLHDNDGRHIWTKPASLPWNEGHMDGGLLKNGKVLDAPDGRVYWTSGGRIEHWFAFFWWDRSGDGRGASNSGFYVRGFQSGEVDDAFKFALQAFPHIVKRQPFPLKLAEPALATGSRTAGDGEP